MAWRRFGDSQEVHAERAKSTLREINRLRKSLRSYMKSPPDCEMAASLVFALAQQSGAYLIDRSAGHGRAGYGGRGVRSAVDRFVKLCVVKPRSTAAARKIRAVWR